MAQIQKELKDLRQSESLLRTKNDQIERLSQDLIREQAKLDQLKEGQDNQEEVKRKKQLIKNMEEDLKSKKKRDKRTRKKK